MALEDILLRITTHSILSAKGSELTYGELDTNFIELYDYIATLNNGSSLVPYSSLTTYTGTQYVSHLGNIYKHISATPSLGISPTGNPTIWQLTSIGQLSHVQNTDYGLDIGGEFPVTAEQLYGMVNNQVVTINLATLQSAISTSGLTPNRIYKVTDLSSYGDVFVRSVDDSHITMNATISIRIPNMDLMDGDGSWIPSASHTIDTYRNWDGIVYKNLTGNNSTTLTPPNDATNWVEVVNSTPQYLTKYYDCTLYNLAGAYKIARVFDSESQNEWGYLDMLSNLGLLMTSTDSIFNICDSQSSIGYLNRLNAPVNTNKFYASNVEFTLGGDASFTGNNFTNVLMICTGEMQSEFANMELENVTLTFPDGLDASCDISNSIIKMGRDKPTIRIRNNEANFDEITITEEGSNLVDIIDATGHGYLDLEVNGYGDAYGIIELTSTNGSETIATIEGGLRIFPIIVRVETGLSVDFTMVSVPDLDVLMGNSGVNFTLDGDKYDYCEFTPMILDGYNIWSLTKLVKN